MAVKLNTSAVASLRKSGKAKATSLRSSGGTGAPFRLTPKGRTYGSVADLVETDPTKAVALYENGPQALIDANPGMTVAQAGARIAILGRYVRAAQG